MAHKVNIGGTAYEIGGGRTLVNGTAYSIDKGKTMVGGTVYEVGFQGQLAKVVISQANGDLPTYVEVDGTPYGYIYDNAILDVPIGAVIKIQLANGDCTCGNYEGSWGFRVNGTYVTGSQTYSHTVIGNTMITITAGDDGECYNCYEYCYDISCRIYDVADGDAIVVIAGSVGGMAFVFDPITNNPMWEPQTITVPVGTQLRMFAAGAIAGDSWISVNGVKTYTDANQYFDYTVNGLTFIKVYNNHMNAYGTIEITEL